MLILKYFPMNTVEEKAKKYLQAKSKHHNVWIGQIYFGTMIKSLTMTTDNT